jgi:hypothetical protein
MDSPHISSEKLHFSPSENIIESAPTAKFAAVTTPHDAENDHPDMVR